MAMHTLTSKPERASTEKHEAAELPMLTEKKSLSASGDMEELTGLAKDPERLKASYGSPTFAAIVEDRFVLGCALVSCIGGLLFGYDQGVISITLVMSQFTEVVPRIADGQSSSGFWKGLLTAMIELGAVIGALSAGFIADRYSRKGAIMAGVAWFIVGSSIQTGSINYSMLICGRVLGGIGIGTLSMVAPLYISELSPPHIRGVLLSLEELCIVGGICIAYYVTFGTRYIKGSEWAWRLPFLIQIIPALVLATWVSFLPYSPRWLAAQGRNKEALTTLARIRRNRPEQDPLVLAEYVDIVAEAELHRQVQYERHGADKSAIVLEAWAWIDCFRKGTRRRVMTGILLMAFQQYVGINSIVYYSPTLFDVLGLNYDTSLVMSGVANLCQLLGVVLSLFFIDRIGRKPLLALGSFGLTITMLVVAILTALFADNWEAHKAAGWVAVSMILAYMVIFGLSWGPVPWAMPAELFPSSSRAHGVALAVVSNWFNNFIVGLITPPLVQKTGYGAFVFFGVFAFVSLLWVLAFVPETKGVPLEQLDSIFGDSTGKEDRQRITAIREKLLAEQKASLTGSPSRVVEEERK